MEGTIPVIRLREYVDNYERHPEAKAVLTRQRSRVAFRVLSIRESPDMRS
jgi:hypothetical protein